MRVTALCLLAVVFVAGCGGSSADGPVVPRGEERASSSVAAVADVPGFYPYVEGVVGGGRPVVLFIAGADCRACAVSREQARSLYAGRPLSVSVYEVDGPGESVAQRYGITHDNTFVLIDARGGFVKSATDPVPAELLEMLR